MFTYNVIVNDANSLLRPIVEHSIMLHGTKWKIVSNYRNVKMKYERILYYYVIILLRNNVYVQCYCQ